MVCDALAEERRCSNRVMVDAARHFASAGFHVLRFDYRHCGESEGEFKDVTVDGMIEDIGIASEFLRREVGDGVPLTMMGLRFGAALAVRASRVIHGIAKIILWEPTLDGAKYIAGEVRRVAVREMMTAGAGKTNPQDILRKLENQDARFDLSGYELTGKLYSGICGINLTREFPPSGTDIFLCQISHQSEINKQTTEYAHLLESAGCKVEQIALREQPFWNPIEATSCGVVVRATAAWLAVGLPSPALAEGNDGHG
ncbi:MAG TPA: alpha/beta hydrolase [Candidatus Brocadiia bacterium]|nr:alpha/beta hydrolase [Candidatus Brocadiia bacterium]